MHKRLRPFEWIFLVFITLFLCSSTILCNSAKSDLCDDIKPHSTIVISKVIDLGGERLELPEDVTLYFANGSIRNGSIVGCQTKISGSKKQIFENVIIEGNWDVPNISTDMIINCTGCNNLKQLFALTNPSIRNDVRIKKGNYMVDAKDGREIIKIVDKTNVKLDGNIVLKPNDYTWYYIVKIIGTDVKITGRGAIIGDKANHFGDSGEWGMGIAVLDAKNVLIKNIRICDCWGDCLYINGMSKGINVHNVLMDNGRRQGISIISGDNIDINHCTIKNVPGTDPQYAIDIEPNPSDTVTNVIFRNIRIESCYGGVKIAGRNKNAIVQNVLFRNIYIKDAQSKWPIELIKGTSVEIRNVHSDSGSLPYALIEEITDYQLDNSVSIHAFSILNSQVKQIKK